MVTFLCCYGTLNKQFSEPNSPIAKTFEEQPLQQKRPPMQRGFSDLGHRIKKRVTLSSIPPQYVGNSTGQPSDRGDVVIVVPNIDSEHLEPVGIEDLASVCIDTEIEIEPGSPKTITESSSKCSLKCHCDSSCVLPRMCRRYLLKRSRTFPVRLYKRKAKQNEKATTFNFSKNETIDTRWFGSSV
uniref:Uncharacterized protein n=1 Tax=Anopheles culicifacies TaxID=139723 RepID=A0A182LX44_9DIPT